MVEVRQAELFSHWHEVRRDQMPRFMVQASIRGLILWQSW